MKKNAVNTDKVYKLKGESAPLSFTLPSRNTKRYPLLYFDEDNNVNRPLRYAINQKSPFEDEQDGNAILEPIVFENGFLSVPKNNPVLQQFLHYHPLNGISFMQVDYEKDAAKEVEQLTYEVDALIEARQLSVDQLETISRVLFNRDPNKFTTSELKRDILIYAKRDPRGFLSIIQDPMLKLQSNIHVFFENKLLTFRNNNKEVWFNTPSVKKKMLTVSYGDDPYFEVAQYLKTDDGIDALKMLENNLDL
jgi:hypothetical protein